MQIEKTFHSDYYIATYIADEVHQGIRLDNFTSIYYPTISRENIKKKIRKGEIKIINRQVANRPSSKIQAGDKIEVKLYKSGNEDEFWNGERLPLVEHPPIIFEDKNLIIISKPPFMATHPTGKHLFYCATVYFESRDKKTIHSIHRLDRETSGILLLARNPKTAQQLTLEFENSRVKKCYFFIAHNQATYTNNTFSNNERLGQIGDDLRARVCVSAFPNQSAAGKHALTHFKIIYRNSKYVIGLAFPQTGRQHQIRVHAMRCGYPLLGDKIYHGGYEMFQHFKDGIATDEEHQVMQIPRHALHAIAINFQYNDQRQTFSTPIPQDLSLWINSNLNDINIDTITQQIDREIKAWQNNLSL